MYGWMCVYLPTGGYALTHPPTTQICQIAYNPVTHTHRKGGGGGGVRDTKAM